jgi:hypothetical protein
MNNTKSYPQIYIINGKRKDFFNRILSLLEVQ